MIPAFHISQYELARVLLVDGDPASRLTLKTVLEAGGYADRISPNGGSISKRRLLSIEGARSASNNTLFDVLLPVAPPRPQR